MAFFTLIPAFGRDYRSKAGVLMDWNQGKDFLICHGPDTMYCSIRDVPHMMDSGMTGLEFRYGSLRKLMIVDLDADYRRMVESKARRDECHIDMAAQHTDRH
jgi:hypothetical protein